ncbi:MAG: hypothetical protein HFJ94_06815 [Muribaculaceae bacterium]|nr:hypothetical protein [Muribaculaceae bacterium]
MSLTVKSKRSGAFVRVGFMEDKDDRQAPEAYLYGRSMGPAIGRIKMGDGDDNAYVELLTTDCFDDAVKPQYSTKGYITQDGIIYKLSVSGKAPKKVGYTAKPSSPGVPSAVGERSWKSLWLKCTLCAYTGVPDEKKRTGQPVAVCYHRSIHSSARDAMPPEARAAAFSFIFREHGRKDYQEYYNSPAYGWKDTALLSAFIYAVGYVMTYLVTVKILDIRFVGFKFRYVLPLYAVYLALWAIVRAVKIESIENSNTVQPKLDLFNKSLGQKTYDRLILILCVLTLAFTGTYYRFDFVPLALAIFTGIAVNMRLKSSAMRWTVNNPLVPDEDENDDDSPHLKGDIERNYLWTLDSEHIKDIVGEMTLYFDSQYMADLRYANPFYCQRKDKSTKALVYDMFIFMKRHRGVTARVRHAASKIKEIAARKGLSTGDTLQFTLDFVQEPNIRFCMNRDSKPINQYEDYIRYPDEVLFDKEADSNSKALLAAMLFHYQEHNVLYLISKVQHHGAVGIEVKDEWIEDGLLFGRKTEEITFSHNGCRYIFCETTADGFRIGGTMDGMRFEDFDEQLLLPLGDNDIDNDSDSYTCIYSWDLDSELGNKLHGAYTLEFSISEIDRLRHDNPFKTYTDSDNCNTYDDNIRTIFNYIDNDASRTEKVREIAKYIKKTVAAANLGELDLVQFALDFCQAPNITYCIDEDSEGIGRAKEYMRFPDEVLFDKEGDCDCKCSLTAAIFRELGYNVIIMLSKKLQHAAIGIEGKDEWLKTIKPESTENIVREYNGKKYLYCETTGDGYRIGHIQDDSSIQDFETIVEINA